MNKAELLAPAGNLKKLKYALTFGADAVYCGLPEFSLRYRINEFDYNDLEKGIKLAHELGKRVYVTVNIYPHKQHLQKLGEHIEKLKPLKPDALIISDPGILSYIKEVWPEVEIHLSTQANCTNWRSAKFWYEQGAQRIILAREATLKDIQEIHGKVPEVELEVFVHGAMCMSYSGRCLLSKWFTDRSGNLGDCSQPCRWQYNVEIEEKKRPGAKFPVEQDDHGTYIMNSKDLCLIEYLDELKNAGVVSFKIEGRAKSIYYLGSVCSVYRAGLDKTKEVLELKKELNKTQNRGFTTGFVDSKETVEERFESSHEKCEWEFCGEVVNNANMRMNTNNANGAGDLNNNKSTDGYGSTNMLEVRVHNQVFVGDAVEFVTPKGEVIPFTVKKMLNQEGEEISESHGGQEQSVKLDYKRALPEMTLIRRQLK
jgi:U32 family peptidase